MKFAYLLVAALAFTSPLAFADGETLEGTNISDFLSAAEEPTPAPETAPVEQAPATPATDDAKK